ncbi:choice-of-anchor Q domain-containing protein [Aquimonas voraii]|uniref:Polymorphic outer membrane protein repeat-containing protein n=1 Tax=Aquimonas voraii TaxID=265719 RepID=A0A1G6U359_9GAMM|nr:choice-of-anchor Q domain-containing protein [Aquimonas voraii]SDD35644.1 hypothetical protein SAMN04488509_102135 [Aquimonas voraii]
MTRPSLPMAFACALALSPVLPASAATFTVTSTADSGPGSLRAAIEAANATSGNIHSVVIELPPDSTIVLQSELPAIEKPGFSISASGSPRLQITDQSQSSPFTDNAVPLLRVAPSNTLLTLVDLSLSSGERVGGGGCLLAEPAAQNATLVLTRVNVVGCVGSRNTLFNSAYGAGVLVFNRSVNITGGAFEFNSFQNQPAGDFRVGGASLAVLADSAKQVVIEGTYFGESFANGGNVSNGLAAAGGAIYIEGGARLSINRSRFSENRAFALGANPSSGGAIHTDGNLLLENTLFFEGGSARGLVSATAADRTRTLNIRNTTFFRGDADGAGNSVIYSDYADVLVRNTTFAGTTMGSASAGEIRVEARAGQTGPSLLRLSHTLFDAGTNPGAACSVGPGVSVERSFNLSSRPLPGCGITTTSTPLRLADFPDIPANGQGGFLALGLDSPAVDAGNPVTPFVADWTTCMSSDARGVARPQNGSGNPLLSVCDIGAYEQEPMRIFRDGFEPVVPIR